ncbi:unnamed protein product [Phytophthora fragariaefolia]|uniref:Unnamed protein product n=1 Tax=Phytophthora fragariaefolia TaxID=1490495 RepID=A0A9W6Y304_9STRA|nr:unnamed protein product [Phytophthora fragariaefolia]
MCPVVIARLDEYGEADPIQPIRYRPRFEWLTRRRVAAASIPKINRVDFTPNPTLDFIIKLPPATRVYPSDGPLYLDTPSRSNDQVLCKCRQAVGGSSGDPGA